MTGEMVELIEHGVTNIACVQPFACLPNHVTGKGVIKVTYLPKGRPGEFEKTVKVRTNSKKNKKVVLKISGVVVP